jgi:hypothetical protein
METATEPMARVQSDVSQFIPLETQLAPLSKPQLIKLADEKLGITVDDKLTKEVIKRKILEYDQGRRKGAQRESEESARRAISDDDPPITVVFYNMMTSDEDISFDFAGPRGIRGPINKNGHTKIPHYHLFPGMQITLPWSVVDHLRSLTWTRHKATYDMETGNINGSIPIITPRFILEQRLSKEEAIALQEMRQKKG